ncbi:nicotinate-nucleotide adenylyltransferase [Kiritimatiella glycovorans]|uniref:Probable nicotinate-nucleotide adenylyltransferase n=1 Tax=Kiritimatiella glycovorans TaxID=1307763 RepID=A0A0G3EFE2_9BACT|nr:nicotinate-nucleotide adenylyltransferase [Kiritimatiella glycovorans]AKJ65171.1 Nicotinate-nucleotide adenylyltransferase [Kiritimatiella glycovorans]
MTGTHVQRIGLFGGTFNPPHLGHLIIAQDALERFELDRMIFIPAHAPPHKSIGDEPGPRRRLDMVRLAVDGHPAFEVSDVEINRAGVSYSIDTLTAMRDQYPEAQLFFLVGGDSLPELHKWKAVRDLLERCTLIIARRAEAECGEVQLEEPWKRRVMRGVFESHRIGISSTEVRTRAAEGQSIRFLVPPVVADYVAEHHLYERGRADS